MYSFIRCTQNKIIFNFFKAIKLSNIDAWSSMISPKLILDITLCLTPFVLVIFECRQNTPEKKTKIYIPNSI